MSGCYEYKTYDLCFGGVIYAAKMVDGAVGTAL